MNELRVGDPVYIEASQYGDDNHSGRGTVTEIFPDGLVEIQLRPVIVTADRIVKP